MRRLFTFTAILAFIFASVQAQTKMTITTKDGNSFVNNNAAIFNYDDETVSFGTDTILPMSQMRSIDFLRDGLPWNTLWKYSNIIYNLFGSSQHYDYGYPSIMHVRDVMTEDLLHQNAYQGLYWYQNWSRNTSIGNSNYRSYFVNIYFMTAIADANRIIKATAQPETDEEKAILGTAYTSRACLYLDYARMYEFLPNDRTSGMAPSGLDITGLTVPIIDENTESSPITGYYSKPRATKSEMVVFIESDLDKAEQLVDYITNPTPLLPHIDVVYGLKARLYLWAGDYDKAREYAERAIASTKTMVMTEEQMTDTQKGFNDANLWMWGIRYFDTDQNTIGLVNWTSYLSNEYKKGYAYEDAPLTINHSLYDSISDSDIRKQLFVAPKNHPLYGKQQLIDSQQSLYEYSSLKFRPANGITDNYEGAEAGVPLMRVEEMYLIAAEAAAHQSPDEGLKMLKEFMKWRDPNYTFESNSQDAVIDEIILQKRIELWGEGQTFFDVKRLNMSVTRDYEGSLFYPAERFNTEGRPAWMNFVFADLIEKYNLSLVDNNNPDPSNVYSSNYKPIDEEEARAAITSGIVLHEPAWKEDIDWIPLDSVSYVGFTYDKAQTSNGITLNYKPQISFSPDFPTTETVSINDNSSNYRKDTHTAYYNIYENVEFLKEATGKQEEDHSTVYLRVKGYVDGCPTVNILSNTISFGVTGNNPYTVKSKLNYSYLPTVVVDFDQSLDLDDLIEVNNPKVCSLSKQGEGELLTPKVYVRLSNLITYLQLDEQGNYIIDDQYYTYANNNIARQLSDGYGWDKKEFPGPQVFKAWFFAERYRNGLYLNYESDTMEIRVTPSRQLWEENRHTWEEGTTKPMISQLDSKFSHNVSFRKAKYDDIHPAEEGDIYLINRPYSDYHNLLFYTDSEGKVNVPSQWAYTDGEKRIYVSGTGTFDGALFDMQLTFATKDGETIGTFNELIGDEWIDLGKGRFSDSFFGDFEYVKIMQNSKNRNLFRINLPYQSWLGSNAEEPTSEYMDLTIIPKGSMLNDQELSQEIVYFTEANTGYYYNSYQAYVYAMHPADWPRYASDQSSWLDSKVMDYQDNGLPGEIVLNPLYVMKDVGSFGKDPINILFPGWRARDYSVSMGEVTTEKDEQGKAYAITTLSLGTDVQNVRALVIKADDSIDDAYETLGNSSEYDVSVDDGTIRVPFNGDELAGELLLIVGVFDSKGQIRSNDSRLFEYYPNGAPWQSLGQGTFTDDIISSLFSLDPVTYSVEIMENQYQPGLYRVMNPYANDVYPYAEKFESIDGDGYYIEIDATDPEVVYIQEQDLCKIDGEKYSFSTMAGYYLYYYSAEELKSYGYMGHLTDGVITFPVFDNGNRKYQGVVNNSYYAGLNGKIEIRLPSATASNNVKQAAPANSRKGSIDQLKKPNDRILRPYRLPNMSKE